MAGTAKETGPGATRDRVRGTKASFPPEVAEILTALIPGVQSALADNLVGAYLRGSLATGDFIETSDIDFLVAIDRPVSDAEAAALIELHERLAALPNPFADRLEGAYIDRASLRRFEPGREFLTIECETPLRWKVHETSWLMERYVLREKGVTLLGPDPTTLIDSISPEELRDAVRQRVREWATWTANPHDPEWLRPRSHQAYVVETICRALYTLAFGELTSKQKAAEWAISALPEPWRAAVGRSVGARADETSDEARIEEVLAFVQWADAEGDDFAASESAVSADSTPA
jgi:predicted nucleotidyltransferase